MPFIVEFSVILAVVIIASIVILNQIVISWRLEAKIYDEAESTRNLIIKLAEKPKEPFPKS